MDVHGMGLPESVDDVEILVSADLDVLTGSHLEHVVCAYHEPAISWQAEERTMSLDCDFLVWHSGEISEGKIECYRFDILRIAHYTFQLYLIASHNIQFVLFCKLIAKTV